VHNEFRVHFVPKLAIEISVVLFGVCVGFIRLARKDFAAWREKRRRLSKQRREKAGFSRLIPWRSRQNAGVPRCARNDT
jgi:hypothetical protein